MEDEESGEDVKISGPDRPRLPRGGLEQEPSFSEFRRFREEGRLAAGLDGHHPPRPSGSWGSSRAEPNQEEHSQGIYCQVPWDHIPSNLQDYHHYPPVFRVGTAPRVPDVSARGQETAPSRAQPGSTNGRLYNTDDHMDYRMSRLERSMADMADTQRTLLQMHTESLARAQPPPHPPQESSRAQAKKEDSSDSDTEPENEGWKESFGDGLWKNVKGKREKNPFEQSSYLKKGETVDSFERVMVVIFKTISQLIDANGEVKGVVRHGLAMAEKASKGVYKIEAFTKYDDSVRERAGAVGPGAFGTVDQEDTLRFFSYDNVERPKGWKQASAGSSVSKKKSEKMCLKYNDQGCSSKTCMYAHRCAACEEVGHPVKSVKISRKRRSRLCRMEALCLEGLLTGP